MSSPTKNRGVVHTSTLHIFQVVRIAHLMKFFVIKTRLDADLEIQREIYFRQLDSLCPCQSVLWVDHAVHQGGCLEQECKEAKKSSEISKAI